jgi:hypothetical protein
MYWTCFLVAVPLPTTACLTCNGVYSCTSRPDCAASSSAIPLACTAGTAESALAAKNSRSQATTSGLHSFRTSRSCSKSIISRVDVSWVGEVVSVPQDRASSLPRVSWTTP